MNSELDEAVRVLKQKIQHEPKIGVILGSGLGGFAEEIADAVRIRYADIPNFPTSTVAGHRGEVVAGSQCGADLLVLSGRIHSYEGYSMQQVVFPIRVIAALNVKTLIVANAAGAINESFRPADIIAISDHINLMGDNPLEGPGDVLDLSEAYSIELRNLAKEIADNLDIALRSGVYVGYRGPSYETPAEIKAMRVIGGDVVGMSTVPEVIMANRLGMKVLGLSIVTNMASGIKSRPLSHREVIETSKRAAPKFKRLLKGIVAQLV